MTPLLPSPFHGWPAAAAAMALAVAASPGAEVIFVHPSNPASTPPHDSWATAAASIDEALAAAAGLGAVELWVASGTYHPGIIEPGGSSRSASFRLAGDITLLGGFDGTEIERDQRHPSLNPTILSGDLGTPGLIADNAYHVVTVTSGSPTIDGFTIAAGHANAASPHHAGGALRVEPGAGPLITGCRFEGNHSSDLGGAVLADASDPEFLNCAFSGNSTGFLGGAACAVNGATPAFRNCSFAANEASGLTGFGGAIYSSPSSAILLANCILWGNQASTDGDSLYGPLEPGSTSNLVEGGTPGPAVVATSDPLFERDPDPGPDLQWKGTGDNDYGDLRLQGASPAIDLGDNSANSSALDLGFLGRLQDGTIDLGAHEVPLELTVSSTADSGPGTLRAAIASIQPPGGATIRFDPLLDGQAIGLASGQLLLDRSVVIDGSDLGLGITVDPARSSRAFEVAADREVILRGFTIRGCRSTPGDAATSGSGLPGSPGSDGGAILNSGWLELDRMTLSDNECGDGGDGDGSGAGGDGGSGGAVANTGTLVLTQSTLSGNRSGDGGSGGDGSAMAGLGGDGGAIDNSGSLVVSLSAIIDNHCGSNGSGAGSGSGNGGGLHQAGTAMLHQSVLAGNTSPSGGADLDGHVESDGICLVETLPGTSGLAPETLSGDPMLSSLADHGGGTRTHHPQPGSPLKDPAGSAALSAAAIDQRGAPRVSDGLLDIGPVEVLLNATVTSASDPGHGSLRQAATTIQEGGSIGFSPSLNGATILLEQGEIDLVRSLTIDASSLEDGITIDGQSNSRIFEVDDGLPGILSQVHLSGLTLEGGAAAGGGAIRSLEELDLEESVLAGNQSSLGGGGVLAEAGILRISGCRFSSNMAVGDGGAIGLLAGATLELDQGEFEQNTSLAGGGSIAALSSNLSCARSRFTEGSAAMGGALRVSQATASITGCRFHGNQASVGGGAISLLNCSPLIVNSAFAGNLAGTGGAIDATDSHPSVVNSSLVANVATTGAGLSLDGSQPLLGNLVIWHNSRPDGTPEPLALAASTPTYTHCLIEGIDLTATGIGNLDGTLPASIPAFAFTPGPGPDGDWGGAADNNYGKLELLAGSTGIDAGSGTLLASTGDFPEDLAGRDRIGGTAIDLGAFEGGYVTFGFLFPGLDPVQDDNQNGISNFADYAAGADPLATHDPGVNPTLDGTRLRFPVRDFSADVVPGLQRSTDLVNWIPMLEGSDHTTADRAVSSGIATISVDLLMPTSPGFFRVDYQQLD